MSQQFVTDMVRKCVKEAEPVDQGAFVRDDRCPPMGYLSKGAFVRTRSSLYGSGTDTLHFRAKAGLENYIFFILPEKS